MNPIRTALLSVYNKTNIVNLGKFLVERGVRIVSTGGTYRMLKENLGDTDKLVPIENLTGFPEILGGRVKTLHPMVHGGLLAKRTNPAHTKDMEQNGVDYIDMIVTNLYPFKQVLESNPDDEQLLLENIDIGGHTMIRAAAKNYEEVLVLTNPNDYNVVMDNWDNLSNNMHFRRQLARQAFDHIAEYDIAIASYYNKDRLYRVYDRVRNLKYGANPQQAFAAIYQNVDQQALPFEVVNGNPGYINFLDAIYAWNLVSELGQATGLPSVASFKHNSPAGVSVYKELNDTERVAYYAGDKELTPLATAFVRARNVDPMSSFGDFIGVHGTVDECTANLIKTEVSDGIVANDFTPEALQILKSKKKGGYIILRGNGDIPYNPLEIREMHGLTLVQDENKRTTTYDSLTNVVCGDIPEDRQLDLIVGNITLKYTQSNSVCSAKDGQVLGVGAGQQSRIDCVKLVRRKTNYWYLRQHPKVLKLHSMFKKGTKRVTKTNAIIRYIENEFSPSEYKEWVNLFENEPEELTGKDKRDFLATLDNVSLASDAFFPFRDNIDVAQQFGVKYIVQPGGSVQDDVVTEACKEYGMNMAMTGRDMRMFLH